ncbi:Bug family tripartite tricarboxylate transporter substrate binding protein [Frigidibacter sp. ROC022]|uniref:Bug family tripartite tricarboxylate transporter substrate binding protein n=1 Tax=Frigidibacter sp. ROC022 TaxID=2971796 RepID=UPI00215A191D|nr:tripartite tricarboxylate transporter substrate-binding protein [Frigidibacter sp. ROC022]MCR8724540.1 tripartite tricarboxylate transporter substrate-binding protein [Frigidibacter sp. ROC022]
MKFKLASTILGLAAGLYAATASVVSAQSPEEFYGANDITLVVGAAAGGGADFYARQFVPFWEKHIPGNPKIIVKNLGGAGGMKAAIEMAHLAPKDGTQISMLLRNNLYDPLVSTTPLDFDPREANWLGSLNKEIYTVAVMTRANINSFEDLQNNTVSIGATSYSNANRVLPAMMNEYFGTKFDIITGYNGAAAMALALEQGELDARMLPVDNLTGYGNEAPLFEAGLIKPVVQTSVESSELFPDVPNLFDFTDDPEVTALAEFILGPMEAGRPFAAPPGVPEDRVATLRKAFMDAAADPDYIKAMTEVANAPSPISGEAVQEIVERLYATPEAVLAKARPLMNPPS